MNSYQTKKKSDLIEAEKIYSTQTIFDFKVKLKFNSNIIPLFKS